MKRVIITAGAGLLVAIPAIAGLAGNTSFAQNLPVHVPSHAIVADDHGGQRAKSIARPGDDHGGQRAKSIAKPGDNHGGQRAKSIAKPGDNHGGQRTTAVTVPVPVDNHGGQRATAVTVPVPVDNHGGQPASAVTGTGKDVSAGQGQVSHKSGGQPDGPGHR